MATAWRLDGLTALRRIDPDAVALGDTVGALLEGAGFEIAILPHPPAGSWFAAEGGVRFQLAGGAPLDAARIGEAVRLLDHADAALGAIEASLGIALEPIGVDPATGEADMLLAFAAREVRGHLALPLDHPRRAAWEAAARTLSPRADRLPVAYRILVDGPRLGVAEAGELGPGDLVLIGASAAAALERADGGLPIAGRVDFASGRFTPHPEGATMATDPTAAGARDFAVPLTVRLPDRVTSAASLAAIRPGTALPLGPLTAGLRVELLVAGRALAQGELVQLGDQFAVLIEERASLDDIEPVAVEVEPDAEGEPAETPA